MHDQLPPRGPVIVTLPTEIDLINQDRAYDQLDAALACGADIVIADFTATTFCDCSSMRRLLAIQARAAARDAQLRVVISPGGSPGRVMQLMELDRRLAVYPSRAAAAAAPPGPDPRDTPGRSPGPAQRGHPPLQPG
jgi:anti-anti-sigma regulatory factor